MKMKQDLLTNLPAEVITEILCRLPIRSIIICKRVCKSFLDLIMKSDFSKHSVPCIAYQVLPSSASYKIIEFAVVDTTTQNSRLNQNQNQNPVLNFRFPHPSKLHNAANSLLFLLTYRGGSPFICNPITREYITLPSPPIGGDSAFEYVNPNTFGFGVSKLSGEYKVVRIFHTPTAATQCQCEVYTLGTGLWTSVSTGGRLGCDEWISLPVLFNGNLHWMVGEYEKSDAFRRILCFDLETECFSTFSVPRLADSFDGVRLYAFEDSLCFWANDGDDGFVMWSMSRYGDDTSWRHETITCSELHECDEPVKISREGEMLFPYKCTPKVCCYSRQTKTFRRINLSEPVNEIFLGGRIRYSPNFIVPVPLGAISKEKVTSF